MRPCMQCGAECRFVLCNDCYAVAPHGEPEQSRQTRDFVPEVGLPVSVDGVHR
jgi:hypothetical protein